MTEEEQKRFIEALIDSFNEVPTEKLTVEYVEKSLCCGEENAAKILAVIMHKRGQIREEVKELIANNEQALSVIFSVCKTFDEVNDVIKYSKLVHGEKETNLDAEIPDEWKKKAYETFKDVQVSGLKTVQVQAKLKVGYGLAVKIKDWLQTIK